MFRKQNDLKKYKARRKNGDKKRQLRKSWILGLAALLLIIGSLTYLPAIKAVNISWTSEKKKLPIYSVETEEKKVALSFDAAWGAC